MLMSLMAVGALIGAMDCIMGNRFGLGERFEEGFLCMGSVALNMVGIICLAPAAGNLLKPVLVPAFHLAGVDPAMFGCLFANNMGGYPLAITLAENQLVGLYSGLIASSMLGAAIVYTIPVGLGLVRAEDRGLFAKGVMIGLIPVPVGAFAGGGADDWSGPWPAVHQYTAGHRRCSFASDRIFPVSGQAAERVSGICQGDQGDHYIGPGAGRIYRHEPYRADPRYDGSGGGFGSGHGYGRDTTGKSAPWPRCFSESSDSLLPGSEENFP